MDFVLKKLFSMQTAVIGLLAFALAVAVATFIENDYGTDTARALVYNALWFELLLVFLALNLVLNMKRYNMYKHPFSMKTLFHASFLLILVGAGVTRYFGYEGTLHIREGQTENRMLSEKSYLQAALIEEGSVLHYEREVLFSKLSDNRFTHDFGPLNTELLEYIPSAAMELVAHEDGVPTLQMMIVGANGGEEVILKEGEAFETPTHIISFNAKEQFTKPVIGLFIQDGAPFIAHDAGLYSMSMDTKEEKNLPASKASPLENRMLYKVGDATFVLKNFYEKALQKLVSKEQEVRNNMGGRHKDALRLRITWANQTKEATIWGNSGSYSNETVVDFGEKGRVALRYGAKLITLPFGVHLVDFELERYPGSMAPSSYASEVVLLDPEQNLKMPYRIYMNHVLDHRGFRLFQSSYDNDELGTVLSVNYDFWGTWITYVGYILLGIGFFGSFVVKGRFSGLRKKLVELRTMRHALLALFAVALFGFAPVLHAEDGHEGHNHAPGMHHEGPALSADEMAKEAQIDKKHAAIFGRLLTQTADGRLEPIDSLGREILAKVVKKSSILGLDSNQIIVGMMTQPQLWSQVNMIKLGNSEIAKLLNLDPKEKYASFAHFYPLDMGDTYVLEHYVNDARRKPPKERNDFDKSLLKVDEAVHICRMVYMGVLFKIFPKPQDESMKWADLIESLRTFDQASALEIRNTFLGYFQGLDEGLNTGNWEAANKGVEALIAYQKKHGSAIYPSDFVISLEILYNKLGIFEALMMAFLLIGSIMLALAFAQIINPKLKISGATRYSFYILLVLFVLYTLGLAMRWIISGHAPWSNGYEALVYIGWSTMVAGFMVSRNSPLTLAATAMLTGITLLVAMISSFDPQITNLVPVLKSYWLTIHVSMITASYGFLGLAALLGFIALVLFAMLNTQNSGRLMLSIQELNIVSEMSILMGLVLLTIGNFLGGVWANESWGRYWGWDAKEAWALVSILVYAALSHIRYIPKFYTDFRFALFSLLSFSSILMTFFGVNYYLSGLHSYAKGDPVPVPTWVYVAIVLVLVLIAAAWNKKRYFTK